MGMRSSMISRVMSYCMIRRGIEWIRSMILSNPRMSSLIVLWFKRDKGLKNINISQLVKLIMRLS